MIRALLSGISGIQNFQSKLDVIGNNIANVGTTGFKSARTEFADSFSQTLRAPAGANGAASGSLQIGTGVATSAIKNVFTQGSLAQTNLDTDLAISGHGFFVVRDPSTGEQFATRAGSFVRDSSGYLVTSDGLRLQGFSNAALTARGDIQVDDADRPQNTPADATMTSFSLEPDGRVVVRLSDGTIYTRGQILLQSFRDTQALTKHGENLWGNLAAAGGLGGTNLQSEAPGTNGLGEIRSRYLEMSNVDLAGEFASLITTQRAFQASARIITTSDEMIQEMVNIKR